MFIFSNLAISLDGKIATKYRNFFPLGTSLDRQHMLKLRTRCDAILIGASTLRSYKKPSCSPQSQSQPINIILSSTLSGISPQWDFFKTLSIQRILIVSPQASPKKIQQFSKTSKIILLNESPQKLPLAYQIISSLKTLGITRLLIEGGGSVMWQFVKYNLIDEYHVTLTPTLLGGVEAPTLVDGEGFEPKNILKLKLKKSQKRGNELYLIYLKTKNSIPYSKSHGHHV